MKIKYSVFNTFFVFLFLELFLNGSGQSLMIGPLTIRMIFYIVAIIVSIFLILNHNKIYHDINYLVAFFLLLTILSSLVGLINGAEINLIFEDIKPLLYFLMIIPFSFFIKNKKGIKLVATLIKYSSIIMAIIYFIYLFMMLTGRIDFLTTYEYLTNESDEIMFRGNNNNEPWIFYKGFMYLNIGFLFYFLNPNRLHKFKSLIIIIAIIMTYTRGFIVSLVLSLIFLQILNIQKKISIFILTAFFTIIFFIAPLYFNFIGERIDSDLIRVTQIEQVLDNINFFSFILGHGFGIGVPIRPIHMEITFLEIFHKQGLIGLLFWIFILFYMIYKYKKLVFKENKTIATPFIISTIFIYIQSFTNPFINNSIGMSLVLITLVVISTLSKIELSAFFSKELNETTINNRII